MPKTTVFKENTKAAGKVSPNDIIKFEFELNDGVSTDQIEYIKPDCAACTKARLEGNKIVGELDVSKANAQYNHGRTPINRLVQVFMNDGQPQFIGDENTKVVKSNPKKKVEKLVIAAIVEKLK